MGPAKQKGTKESMRTQFLALSLSMLLRVGISPGQTQEPATPARQSPYDQFLLLIGAAHTDEDAATQAGSYLRSLSDAELIELGEKAALEGDAETLAGPFCGEQRRRLRYEHDTSALVSVLRDPQRPESLRTVLFTTIKSSIKFLSDEDRAAIWKAAAPIALETPDSSVPLRCAALRCANSALAGMREGGAPDPAEMRRYAEVLETIAASPNEHPQVRRFAIRGIADHDFAAAVPTLLQLLTDEKASAEPAIARSACMALADLRVQEAVDPIGNLLATTRDEAIYSSAACALGDFGSPDGLRWLLTAKTRFDGGAAEVAIERQRSIILQALDDANSQELPLAVQAASALFRDEDVSTALERLISLLPFLTDDDIRRALLFIHERGTKQECSRALTFLPRRAAFAAEWDAIQRRTTAEPLEGQPSNVPVDE